MDYYPVGAKDTPGASPGQKSLNLAKGGE